MNILRQKKAAFLSIFLAMTFIRTAFAQDFNFTLQPSTLTLVPGQSASFVISIAPVAGFTNQVTLATTNLPSGVTASFSPQTITPPGTSILTLTATTNATTGDFNLEITANGGGITHMTTSSVSVSFGLLPLCYGALQGLVTDATTGKPIPGVSISAEGYYATTDAKGMYLVTNLGLAGSENLPEYYYVQATSNGYYSVDGYGYAVCDATNTVNISMVPLESGSLSGSLVSSDGTPLTNETVTASYQYQNYTTTSNGGLFQFSGLGLSSDNGAAYYNVQAQPSGYWYIQTNVIVQANSNAVVSLVVVPVCYQTVYGRVVYSNTGLPATNIVVDITTVSPTAGYEEYLSANTDANGNYSISNVTLGYNNTARIASIETGATGYYEAYTNVDLTECSVAGAMPGQPGGAVEVGEIVLDQIPAPPTNNYGMLNGYIYDVQTGLPITNASVYIYGTYYTTSGSNGFYAMTNVYVGNGPTTNAYYAVTATANGYFANSSNIVVDAGETTLQNIYLLRIGYGGVEGTVFDIVTGLPITDAYVSISPTPTGSNGQYSSGPIQLNLDNTPTYEYINTSKTGYWAGSTNTTLTNGVTNVVNIEMLPVCTGATILGNVVNALTQAPITNATIYTYSGIGSYIAAMTDTNGNFIMTNVTVGNNNSPTETTLNATAPGFNPQSKTVTIFCDATISTTFGAPETNFGAIHGFVTNVLTGLPLTNVFIGSSFGGATTTDTNGYYILNQVPLNTGGSNRTWTVTAIPSDFPAQTKSVVVSANTTNELDFGFGQPLTELVIAATGTPDPVNVGSNLTYSITLTNYKADATNIVLTDTLPLGVTFVHASITNNPGGFVAPVESNGVVTLTGSDLSSNAGVVLLITVTPTTAGGLTNIATVTSDTPDVSPGPATHTAIVIGTAQEVESIFADVGITMTGTPNPVLASNQLTYQLVANNNYGPDTAPSVIVTDTLPANVTFGSISVSQGSYSLASNTVLWNVGSLAFGASASATIVVLPLQVGQVENIATIGLGPTIPLATDDDPDNNTAEVFTTVTTPTVTTGSIQYGAIQLNPQTGLFEQTVQYFSQAGGPPVRVSVLDLPSSIQLYNATGTSNGVPYVEYDNTVPSGGSVTFLLEYYEGSRLPFVSTNFLATAVVAVTVPPTSGTYLQLDVPAYINEGRLTIEFATVPGHTYQVQYSSDMKTWTAAVPEIVASNTRTDWVDAGPPVTTSAPQLGSRFYRIVEIK